MKPLKEIIREQYANENQYQVFHNLIQEEKDINAFKKWLRHKRRELNSPKWDSYIASIRQIFIDELLEELKEEEKQA